MSDFLTNSTNKYHLIKHFLLKWRYNFFKKFSGNQVVYLADIYGFTIKIGTSTTTVLEFTYDQEEVDTRIFAYGKFIMTRYSVQRMIISFSDTDIAVISFYQKVSDLESIDKICLKFCVSVNKPYFPIHCINEKLNF